MTLITAVACKLILLIGSITSIRKDNSFRPLFLKKKQI